MKLCDEDEIRIHLDKIDNLYFGKIDLEEIKTIKKGKKFFSPLSPKAKGVVLESDYNTKLKTWTYFVEMNKDFDQRFWFLESEIYLI